MSANNQDTSLETLEEIRSIMQKSTRFLSLSGWSGVWAGSMALVGATIAGIWLHQIQTSGFPEGTFMNMDMYVLRFLMLGAIIFLGAFVGGIFFTARKVTKLGLTLWNNASKQLALQIAIPIAAAGVFIIGFLMRGYGEFIAPVCLVFYGLALINGSKYTLSDIRVLGLLEVVLGCINIFLPGYGLYFWAFGFGILHIVYGIIMWNKYDRINVSAA